MACSLILAALVAASSPLAVQADLPVHCLRHQVVGSWEFSLGPLGPKRTSCGHTRPDNPQRQPALSLLSQEGETTTRHFSLLEPDGVQADDGTKGTWTMIYDEAFEVAVGDMVYLAFSKFDFVTDAQGKTTNQSHCGETQVGWYRNADRSQWGCYVGKKTDAADENQPPAAPVKKISQLSWAATVSSMLMPSQSTFADQSSDQQQQTQEPDAPSQDMLALQDPPQQQEQPQVALPQEQQQQQQQIALPQSAAQLEEYLDKDSPLADLPKKEQQLPVDASPGFNRPMPNDWQDSVAEALNFLQLGWSAQRYPAWEGKTPRQLNKLAGQRRPRHNQLKGLKKEDKSFNSFLGISASRRTRGAADQASFDWRNANGGNWLEPVVTQGDCGSCYTISTVHMLTARNRIHKRDMNEPTFSVSFPLYCSEYNQGCDGGYGFLQSKWLEDVGLVSESCAPFSQGGGKCEIKQGCDMSKRYHASGHHYVGGYYGGSDEQQVREELVKNGPVVMSFEPKEDFMYYKAGVYKSGPNKIHQEWEQVDHAVLLIAFGKEDDKPYWTLQNSWGNDWGEDGFFRMARGIDESGCESIVVAAMVEEDDNTDVLNDVVASMGQVYEQ